jgi:hypothetical protein
MTGESVPIQPVDGSTVPAVANIRRAEDDDVCAGCGAWTVTVRRYTTRRGLRVWLCGPHAFRAWLDGILPERQRGPIVTTDADSEAAD